MMALFPHKGRGTLASRARDSNYDHPKQIPTESGIDWRDATAAIPGITPTSKFMVCSSWKKRSFVGLGRWYRQRVAPTQMGRTQSGRVIWAALRQRESSVQPKQITSNTGSFGMPRSLQLRTTTQQATSRCYSCPAASVAEALSCEVTWQGF